jgi:hypothetical protein
MKKYVLFIFSLLLNYQIYSQAIGCRSNINVALDIDGNATLSPEMIMFTEPIPGFSYSVSPNRVYTCEDIGIVHYVLVIETNAAGEEINSCFSNITIEDKLDRPPLNLAVISVLNVNLGVGNSRPLTPDMFLTGPPCEGCTYTVTPSSVTCDNIGTPLTVVIEVRDQFCQENSIFSTVNTFGGIGCSVSMSILPFWRNRMFFPGDPLPFFINLSQLTKKPNYKEVFVHFFLSEDQNFNLNTSIYVGIEKLNANQKQKKSKVQIPEQIGNGKYFLHGVLSESKNFDQQVLTANAFMEFLIGTPNGNLVSGLSSSQQISVNQHQITLNEFSGGEIKIYSIQGYLLKSLTIKEGESFTVNDLAKGILIIQSRNSLGEVKSSKYFNY